MPQNEGAPPSFKVLREVAAAGCGSGIADSAFNPLEVVKVRLQLLSNASSGVGGGAATPPLYRGFGHALAKIYADDGLAGMWTPGLVVTWIRAMFYTGCRIGLYPAVSSAYADAFASGRHDVFALRLAAGATTGALASLVFSPLDLIRIRLQGDAGRIDSRTKLYSTGLRAGTAPRYSGIIDCASRVAAGSPGESGVRALWAGCAATCCRAAVLSGTQLATYETIKATLRDRVFAGEESVPLHLIASCSSGLAAQLACQPADVMRTLTMGGGNGGVLACARSTYLRHGVPGFFRGLAPALARQGPVMLVQMPLVEQFRVLFGLGYM